MFHLNLRCGMWDVELGMITLFVRLVNNRLDVMGWKTSAIVAGTSLAQATMIIFDKQSGTAWPGQNSRFHSLG